MMTGEIERDESYLDDVRKGKRRRGAGGKIQTFRVIETKRQGSCLFSPNARTETLLPIIRHAIKPVSIVYIAGFATYDVFGSFRVVS